LNGHLRREVFGEITAMPDISATERGKRYFQVMKEKQAEKAISRIQKQLKADWQVLSLADVRILKSLLGEVWVYLEQKTWDRYPFHELSRQDVRKLIEIGTALQNQEIPGRTAATCVEDLLKGKTDHH
jgi:hypothetical protein